MSRSAKTLPLIAKGFNALASLAVLAMMGLTCLDVLLRFFRRPIPGTYEMVGLLGALFVAFSLAETSLQKGHIAVSFLVDRFSKRKQALIDGVNGLIAGLFFALVAFDTARYAADLRANGEVSMTLKVPLYPFVYCIAAGCALLCLILLNTGWQSMRQKPTASEKDPA